MMNSTISKQATINESEVKGMNREHLKQIMSNGYSEKVIADGIGGMDKDYLKNVMTSRYDTAIIEDVVIEGRKVDLMSVGSNGIYICLNKDGIDLDDLAWYGKLKEKYAEMRGPIFLYTFAKEAPFGCFYCEPIGCAGSADKVDVVDDIEDTFETSYTFAHLALGNNCNVENVRNVVHMIGRGKRSGAMA